MIGHDNGPQHGGRVYFGLHAIAAALDLTEAAALDGIERGRIPAFRMGLDWGASEAGLAKARTLRHARAS